MRHVAVRPRRPLAMAKQCSGMIAPHGSRAPLRTSNRQFDVSVLATLMSLNGMEEGDSDCV